MLTTTRSMQSRLTMLLSAALVIVVLAGCGNLREQPKFNKPYDSSPTFDTAARNISPEAIPRGYLREDEFLYNGTMSGEYVTSFPEEVTLEMLEEGRRQFEGFCMPCHGYGGYGDGIIALEGLPQPGPASFHDERLVDSPNGYFFDVITNGQGLMFSYASRISPENRWAIIAYIRALQFSQDLTLDDLPADMQAEFSNGG